MYKIYINDYPLILQQQGEDGKEHPSGIVLPYMGGRNQLLNVVDKYEKSTSAPNIILEAKDLEKLFKDFKGLFKYIKAAGGVVLDGSGRVLFIYRFDRWDLPKGKRSKAEKNREAAMREVREETGIDVQIHTRLGNTYHTYRMNGRRVLKKTCWYLMRPLSTELRLQSEEAIEAAAWRNPAEFLENEENTYASIFDVINKLLAFLPAS